MKKEPLLGGSNATPATDEEKQEFKRLMASVFVLDDKEMDRLQELEWKLTKSEYLELGKD